MGLVRKTTLGCDFAQRHVGRKHELPGAIDSATNEEFVRRSAQAVAERDIEVEFAVVDQLREIPVPEGRREVGLDMLEHPAFLPGVQPRARDIFSLSHAKDVRNDDFVPDHPRIRRDNLRDQRRVPTRSWQFVLNKPP